MEAIPFNISLILPLPFCSLVSHNILSQTSPSASVKCETRFRTFTGTDSQNCKLRKLLNWGKASSKLKIQNLGYS